VDVVADPKREYSEGIKVEDNRFEEIEEDVVQDDI